MYDPKMTYNLSLVSMCSKTILILIFANLFGFINDLKCFYFDWIQPKDKGDAKFCPGHKFVPKMLQAV